MQFKRPLNVSKTRKDGVPSYVNSFQFLRANRLILSVKIKELINGWEIPAGVMARCKDAPLTEQELDDWKQWKREHDKTELIGTDAARFRLASEQVCTTLRDAGHALKYDLVTLTETAVAEQWEALDEYARQLQKMGHNRPTRPRGRPKAKQIIYVDDADLRWTPNFHNPNSPEYAQYEEALRQAGKRPGDPV